MYAIKTTTAALLATGLLCSGAQAAVTPLSGELDPDVLDVAIGAGNTGQLIGDTNTHWASTTSISVVDLNGFTMELDSGGGNFQTYNGSFTGPGTLSIIGAPNVGVGTPPINDIALGGSAANTMTNVTIVNGTVTLNKTPGVDALTGPITQTGSLGDREGSISWAQSNQINDASTIDSSGGAAQFILELNDNTDTIAGLTLKDGDIVETESSGVLTVSSLTVDGNSFGPGVYTSSSAFITGGGSVVVIPEPGSLALLGLGGLVMLRRRRG